jgi:hypothetical protein
MTPMLSLGLWGGDDTNVEFKFVRKSTNACPTEFGYRHAALAKILYLHLGDGDERSIQRLVEHFQQQLAGAFWSVPPFLRMLRRACPGWIPGAVDASMKRRSARTGTLGLERPALHDDLQARVRCSASRPP